MFFCLCRERRKLLSTLPVSRIKTSYFPLCQPLSARQVPPQQLSSLSPHRRASPHRAVTTAVRLGWRASRWFLAFPKNGELLSFEIGKYFKSCVKKPNDILLSLQTLLTNALLHTHCDHIKILLATAIPFFHC